MTLLHYNFVSVWLFAIVAPYFLNISPISSRGLVLFYVVVFLVVATIENLILQNVLLILQFDSFALLFFVLVSYFLNDFSLRSW